MISTTRGRAERAFSRSSRARPSLRASTSMGLAASSWRTAHTTSPSR
jgi:hypothetical protein